MVALLSLLGTIVEIEDIIVERGGLVELDVGEDGGLTEVLICLSGQAEVQLDHRIALDC